MLGDARLQSAQSNHPNLSYFRAASLLLEELQRFQLRQWHILEVNRKQALNEPKCKKTSWMIARASMAIQVKSFPLTSSDILQTQKILTCQNSMDQKEEVTRKAPAQGPNSDRVALAGRACPDRRHPRLERPLRSLCLTGSCW